MWPKCEPEFKVDDQRKLVFFHGFKETPLEKHGYVVAINRPGHIRRLTELQYSHSCDYYEVSSYLSYIISFLVSEVKKG